MTSNPEHDDNNSVSPFELLLQDEQLAALAHEPLPTHVGIVNNFCDAVAEEYCMTTGLEIDGLKARVKGLSQSFGDCLQELIQEGSIFSSDRDEAQTAVEPLVGLLLGELSERKNLLAQLTGCQDFLGSKQFKLSANNLSDNDLIPALAIQISDKFMRKKPEKTAARLFDDYVADLLADLDQLKDHHQTSASKNDAAITIMLVRTGGISFDLARNATADNDPQKEQEHLYTTYSFTVQPPIKF
ncbi:MAG: hypothetical protein WBO35_02605 [Candidatus Saccharimonadales bacterium]